MLVISDSCLESDKHKIRNRPYATDFKSKINL